MNRLKLFPLPSKLLKCLNPKRFHSQESFLSGSSSQYIEDMYNAWLQDPKSVHASWDSFFRNTNKGIQQAYQPPPNLAPNQPNLVPLGDVVSRQAPPSNPPPAPAPSVTADQKTIEDHLSVQGIIRSYQARGHCVARLDPLRLMEQENIKTKEILKKFKLEDLDKLYTLPRNTFIGGGDKKLPLKEILKRLEHVYCRHIGVEFIYVDSLPERQFIREKMETPGSPQQTPEQKRRTLRRLIRTSEFENFLAKKWASEKRFGIEGCDMFIPGLKQIIDKSTELGVEHFIIGIAHRGRLNLLANVFRKPMYLIFNQFVSLDAADLGSGDVKYHYGSHTERTNRMVQKTYQLTLLANPSHLEATNPTVLGRTRAEQVQTGDLEGKKSMAILIHGDAAFSGQGINYETLGLSYLPNYTTHGVICIVINNQIGFTTDPRSSRSSRYCTDLGRVVEAPIFHVNADDPDSVIHVCNIAAEYRAKFQKDIVIDLVGYRRYGHNEADEPMFTQPMMYKKVSQLQPVAKRYEQQLINEKIVTLETVKAMEAEYQKLCEDEFVKASQQTKVSTKDWLDSPWTGFFRGRTPLQSTPTGVPEATLLHIAKKFSSPPPKNLDFVLHKGLTRMLIQRQKLTEDRQANWAMAEALAIGSLVHEGIPVRLSGEDVERGTFSHRHHILHHQTVDKVTYEPLSHLFSTQAKYTVCNSSLSEYGVLGFEVGYAQANPNCLVMWEAQFGDFFNTAQPVFDQFLCSGETKWARQNGVVVLLPHGYEGMGPEHSSARPERFLQLCDDDPESYPPLTPEFAIKQLHDCNWIIANCSTPANMFHILRRQICLPFRKPLVIFTPKFLLRYPECVSPFAEMTEGSEFRRFIPEQGEAGREPGNVKKLIMCTGKIYYEIVQEVRKKKLEKEIAVARVEQISPFPYDLVKQECDKYDKAKLVWAQEEPKNNGAYSYVITRLNTLLEGKRPVKYVGRAAAAAPATGVKAQHLKEVETLRAEFVALQ